MDISPTHTANITIEYLSGEFRNALSSTKLKWDGHLTRLNCTGQISTDACFSKKTSNRATFRLLQDWRQPPPRIFKQLLSLGKASVINNSPRLIPLYLKLNLEYLKHVFKGSSFASCFTLNSFRYKDIIVWLWKKNLLNQLLYLIIESSFCFKTSKTHTHTHTHTHTRTIFCLSVCLYLSFSLSLFLFLSLSLFLYIYIYIYIYAYS